MYFQPAQPSKTEQSLRLVAARLETLSAKLDALDAQTDSFEAQCICLGLIRR